MSASYPSSSKNWTPVVDGVDNINASHMNEAYDEIIAIESDLLTNGTQAQSNGFYFDKDYYYQSNTKMISLYNVNYTSVYGVQSADTVNVKINVETVKILNGDNSAGSVYSNNENLAGNFETFNNGSSSSTADFISIIFYVSDAAKVDTTSGQGVFVKIGSVGFTNYFETRITTISTGWNYAKVAKSDFTTYGTPNWAMFAAIQIGWVSLANAQNSYVSFNLIQLIRKDSILNSPNIFQRYSNGLWINDFVVNSGEWFIGQENDVTVCRNINPSSSINSLLGTRLYSNFIASQTVRLKTTSQIGGITWYIDSSNYIYMYTTNSFLYLKKVIGGTETSASRIGLPIRVIGDIVRFTLSKIGTTVVGSVSTDGFQSSSINIEFSLSGSGYIGCKSTSSAYVNLDCMSITTTNHSFHSDVSQSAITLQGKNAYEINLIGRTNGTNQYSFVNSYYKPIQEYKYFQPLTIVMGETNTGASTINISGLGDKGLKKIDGTDFIAGELLINQPYSFVYNGTNFISLSPNNVSGSDLLDGKHASDFVQYTSGNVGISASTPTSKLHIEGDGGVNSQILLRSTGNSDGNIPSFSFQSTETGGLSEKAKIVSGQITDSTKGYLAFNTRRADTITEAMRILDDGKIGIGNASPTEALDVTGNAKVSGTMTVGGDNVAKYKSGTGTFASGGTTYQVTDAFVTTATMVTVVPTGTKIGIWTVDSAAGSFTITSDTTETSTVNFNWFAVK